MTREGDAGRSETVHDARRLATVRSYAAAVEETDRALSDIVLLAGRICGKPISLVNVVDGERAVAQCALGLEDDDPSVSAAFCRHAIRQQDVFEVPDARQDPRFSNRPMVTVTGIRHYAGTPLIAPNGLAIGTLCVLGRDPGQLSAVQREALLLLARQVMARLELRLNALRDPLTRVFSRAYLLDSLSRELKRARRSGSPVAVLAVDLDRFRESNEALGRQTGDQILRTVAGLLARSVRDEDIVCRAGGDGFAVIMPEGTREVALARAEALRAGVENEIGASGLAAPRRLSVSIGVAIYPHQAFSPSALLQAADDALKVAKASRSGVASLLAE